MLNWICQILVESGTSQILLNTSIAILTIFIPIAISLFENKKDPDYDVLDRAVILDYLIQGQKILWELSLLFLPVLLWSVESFSARIIALIAWIIGVRFAVLRLSNLYQWLRGKTFDYRFKYLESLGISQEIEGLWRSVWEAKDINRENEKKFFDIFKSKVDSVFSTNLNKELKILLRLIQDFVILINKRDIIFLTSRDDVFPEILRWHKLCWQREYSHIGDNDDHDLSIAYSSLSVVFDDVLRNITERSLNGNFPYNFFEVIEKHIKDNIDYKVTKENHDYFYLESLLPVFYSRFFNFISKSPDKYHIWKDFPDFLRITEETIDQIPARITLRCYIDWAMNRIRGGLNEEKYDSALEDVSKELFPTTEPIFWAVMMTLLMRSWGENRMKSLIENDRKFGFIGRMVVWSGTIGEKEPNTSEILDQQMDEQLKSSVRLLIKIFKHEFSLNKINAYIEQLEDLDYSKDEKKEAYKKQVHGYLEEIKKVLENNKN